MPNGEIIESSHKALLPMTQLPLKAREAIIFPKLKKPFFQSVLYAIMDEQLHLTAKALM